jgi:hypothetical protein
MCVVCFTGKSAVFFCEMTRVLGDLGQFDQLTAASPFLFPTVLVLLNFSGYPQIAEPDFFVPPQREFSKYHNTKKNTRTFLAAVAPAEAGSIGSTVPVVWKEETVVFVRGRVRVERTALEIAGG